VHVMPEHGATLAVRLAPGEAVHARAAGEQVVQAHPIPRGQGVDALARTLHDPGDLMTERDRQRAHRGEAGTVMSIGVADTRRADRDANLVAAGIARDRLLQLEGPADGPQAHGSHAARVAAREGSGLTSAEWNRPRRVRERV